MAEFEQDLQRFEFSIPYSDTDSDLEMISQFMGPNASMMGNFSNPNFAVDNFLRYQKPEYQAVFAQNLPGTLQSNCLNKLPILDTITSTRHAFCESNKRKPTELPTSSSESSPSTASRELKDNNNSARKNRLAKGKKRDYDKERDKQVGVIHVRAKRGQATDNHSLAERVRRQKINYKLRCLEDLVPGCNKTMGMAVMLDEIINYVHSLKNQVEFLSMEIAAACSSYTTEKAKGTSSQQAYAMEIWEREQNGEQTRFHAAWPV